MLVLIIIFAIIGGIGGMAYAGEEFYDTWKIVLFTILGLAVGAIVGFAIYWLALLIWFLIKLYIMIVLTIIAIPLVIIGSCYDG